MPNIYPDLRSRDAEISSFVSRLFYVKNTVFTLICELYAINRI